MFDEALISESLELVADRRTAGRTGKSVQTLRGIRGVPTGDLARLAAAMWEEQPVDLVEDRSALSRLFGAAWEDGLVAIGLCAAACSDDAEEALDLGLEWLTRVDDIATADALGWLVLGPACLAAGRPVQTLISAAQRQGHPAAKRAVVMAAMACTSTRVEGPAAAPLRARLGVKHVQMVEAALNEPLGAILTAFLRDESKEVRKGLRRVLRAWTQDDPVAVAAWGASIKGGLPKLLGAEVQRAARRASRVTTDMDDAAE